MPWYSRWSFFGRANSLITISLWQTQKCFSLRQADFGIYFIIPSFRLNNFATVSVGVLWVHMWWIFLVHISVSMYTISALSNVVRWLRVIVMIVWVLAVVISENCDGILVGFIALVFCRFRTHTHTRTPTRTHTSSLPNFWDRYALIMQHFPFTWLEKWIYANFRANLFNETNPFRHTSWGSHIRTGMDGCMLCFTCHSHALSFSNMIQVQLTGEIFHVIFI